MLFFKNLQQARKKKLDQEHWELFLKVRGIVANQLKINDPERIKPDTRFKEELGLDSLDALELMMEMERVFDLEIPDEVGEKMFCVEEIVDYLEKRA